MPRPALRELDWWQSHRVAGLEVVMMPVQHWSGGGLFDRMKTLWGGYAAFEPDLHLYFAGDSGYSQDFASIGARCADRQKATAMAVGQPRKLPRRSAALTAAQ